MKALLGLFVAATLLVSGQSVSAERPMTPHELHALVSGERDRYVAEYVVTYKNYCASRENKCVAELLIRPNKMPWPDPYALIRLDMISNVSGVVDAGRFEKESPFTAFDARDVTLGNGFTFRLHPLVWNRVEVRARSHPLDVAGLTAWANKWMDVADTKPKDANGFSGVVHSVTMPTTEDAGTQFTVDFGTAPIESFDDFLKVVNEMKLRSVEIGSFGPVQ